MEGKTELMSLLRAAVVLDLSKSNLSQGAYKGTKIQKLIRVENGRKRVYFYADEVRTLKEEREWVTQEKQTRLKEWQARGKERARKYRELIETRRESRMGYQIRKIGIRHYVWSGERLVASCKSREDAVGYLSLQDGKPRPKHPMFIL